MPLFASIVKPIEIDISKKGIALGTFLAYNRALNLAKKFPQYDIYIKKTTTTVQPYYVVFIVNIQKQNQKYILKTIKQVVPSAYITSDSRIEQLHNDIHSDIAITKKIDKKYTKDIITIANQIDTSKKAISVTYTNNQKRLKRIKQKLKGYDIFIKKSTLSDNYIIYVVNIEAQKLNDALKYIKELYPKAKETSTKRIDYFIKNYTAYDIFIASKLKQHLVSNTTTKQEEEMLTQFPKVMVKKYNEAKKYYKSKQYKKSAEILSELSALDPNNTNINFYLGRSYYELKQYEQASVAFERITIADEKNLRARLELAQTYMQLKLNNEALKNFNYVLEQNIPTLVKDNILKKIAFIKSLKQRHFFNGFASVDITYDNNVNNKNGENTFTISGITADQALPRDDIIYTYNLTGNYIYKITDKKIINTTLSYNFMDYEKDKKRLGDTTAPITDIKYATKKKLEISSASSYFTYMNNRSIFSVGVDTSYIRLARDHFFTTYGLGINYSKKFYSNISFFTALKYFKKEYKPESKNQNSLNTQFMLGSTYPTVKYGDFSLIYLYAKEDITRPDLFVDTHMPSSYSSGGILSYRYSFSNKTILNSMIMYNNTYKDSKEGAFETIQNDSSRTFSLGVDYKYNKKTIFSPNLKYIKNNSTINLFDYKKKTVGVTVKRFF
jgi:TolA-binding protein